MSRQVTLSDKVTFMPRWTPESRRKQSELLHQLRPWERSTGPRTRLGKFRSSRNSLKNGEHTAIAQANRLLARLVGAKISDLVAESEDVTIEDLDREWDEFVRNLDDQNELFK